MTVRGLSVAEAVNGTWLPAPCGGRVWIRASLLDDLATRRHLLMISGSARDALLEAQWAVAVSERIVRGATDFHHLHRALSPFERL
jgi:hypothetical protein